MGGSPGRRCFLPVQRKRYLQPGNRPLLPRKHPGKRRHGRSGHPLQTLPGKGAGNRGAAEEEWDKEIKKYRDLQIPMF